MIHHPLSGVYAAAVTPLHHDGSLALDDIPPFLAFLAERGCHGALLLGTTGEGPSFAAEERLAIFAAATKIREVYPDFRLLAGTGTPSLEETIFLSKSAFDLGFDATVVLPPYFYHQATEDGLFYWFQTLITRAVPSDGYLLGYHFPAQSGVPIPIGVLSRLRIAFPKQFAGLKDSTSNADHTFQIGKQLDQNLLALVGNDKLLLPALDAGASGCITAMANLHSPTLRKIWDAFQLGVYAEDDQEYIVAQRNIMDHYPPFAPSLKFLLHQKHRFPAWGVRMPLTSLAQDKISIFLQEMGLDPKNG